MNVLGKVGGRHVNRPRSRGVKNSARQPFAETTQEVLQRRSDPTKEPRRVTLRCLVRLAALTNRTIWHIVTLA